MSELEQENKTSLTLIATDKIKFLEDRVDWLEFFSINSPVDLNLMPDQSRRITHKTNYKISQENYSQWPKFYSIVLENNIVSLEFRNNPDFSSINNVLNLFQANFEFRAIPQSENKQHMLKITSNGILILGYLYNIYSAFSKEAAEVLYFVLIHLAEYEIDKKNPDWKQDISMRIAAWSDPDDDETDSLEIENFCSYYLPYSLDDSNLDFNHHSRESLALEQKYYEKSLKEKYRNLTPEEKQYNFRNLTLELINKEVIDIISKCSPDFIKEMSYYQKYEQIEKIFETTDKCNQYLYTKNNSIQSCVHEMQILIEEKLNELFTPSILKQFGSAIIGDSVPKYAKSGSSAIGGTLDILKATGHLTAKLPVVGIAIGFAKLYSSGVFFSKETGFIAEEEEKEINLVELSKSFTCKVTICSVQKFISIAPESYKDLALFYANFIYKSITKNHHPYPTESYLASHLLDKLSNKTYIAKLDLKDLLIKLKTIDNQTITIEEYIQNYNQTICYAEIHSELMGIKEKQATQNIIEVDANEINNQEIGITGETGEYL